MTTKLERHRKLGTHFKAAIVDMARRDPDVKNAWQLMAGRRIWGLKRKQSLAGSTAHKGDWDVLFGHITTSWAALKDRGPLICHTDGLWLSGAEVSYYNFVRPGSGATAWSCQVMWGGQPAP